jgi:hypothetical protein
VGRPRQYCRQSCRQQAHLARKLAAAHRLGPDETVVRTDDLTELQDRLYTLQAALEDVTNDLADDDGPDAVRAGLEHVMEAARPVAALWITPVADRTDNST